MEIVTKYKHNSAYFQQYWDDWLQYKSKGRQYIFHATVTLLALGVITLAVSSTPNTDMFKLGVLLVALGILLITWHFWDKKKWLNNMIEESNINSEIIMTFTDEGIKTKTTLSSGEAKWDILREIIPAKNGIFLVLYKGISIYIPNYSLTENNSSEQIIEMFNNKNA